MPESYDDVVRARVRRARIKRDDRQMAIGYKINPKGHNQRVTRDELRDIARKLCVDMGWSFKLGGPDVVP